jgi:hypothetical protein
MIRPTKSERLIGRRYAGVTVLGVSARRTKHGQVYMACRCNVCDAQAEVLVHNLPRIKSCGCMQWNSEAKRDAAIANAKAGTAAVLAKVAAREPWKCEQCGLEKPATAHQKRQVYCSIACMAKAYGTVKYKWGKKDKNHDAIVAAIKEHGGHVIDCSKMGNGFPDIIGITKHGEIQLAEIKNPDNHYGKKGLNNCQAKYVKTLPTCIYLLRTVEDAKAFAFGEFDKLEKAGGPDRQSPDEALRAVLGAEVMK